MEPGHIIDFLWFWRRHPYAPNVHLPFWRHRSVSPQVLLPGPICFVRSGDSKGGGRSVALLPALWKDSFFPERNKHDLWQRSRFCELIHNEGVFFNLSPNSKDLIESSNLKTFLWVISQNHTYFDIITREYNRFDEVELVTIFICKALLALLLDRTE